MNLFIDNLKESQSFKPYGGQSGSFNWKRSDQFPETIGLKQSKE